MTDVDDFEDGWDQGYIDGRTGTLLSELRPNQWNAMPRDWRAGYRMGWHRSRGEAEAEAERLEP